MNGKHRIGLRAAGWVGLSAGLIGIAAAALSSPRASGGPAPGGPAPGGPAPIIVNLGSLESVNVFGAPAVSQNGNDLVVHEWGTFLGMSGSDGTSLDAMYHEEHALPGFVHGRTRDQLRLPHLMLKGETPVIYFYTPNPARVRVGVDFPQGIWTHWYPQAALVNPPLDRQAETPDRPKDGRICWFAELIPPSMAPASAQGGPAPAADAAAKLPATSSDALWNYARDVDAAYVKTIDGARKPATADYERFLFYRGLGRVPLPLHADATAGGTLSLENQPGLAIGVRHIYIVRVEGGRGAYAYRPSLRPGERATGVIPSMGDSQPMAEFTERIANDLAARLTESGLYAKEARAMVNTWKTSYFQSDGIRVLFVLPQSWTDSFIPMRLLPKPRELVRVMVGRLELLSPERERRAESAVRDLASIDPSRRQSAFAFLREQGRYVEPIVRRLATTTKDESVRTLCRRLILTDFVTDIRAAIHNAEDGQRLRVDQFQLRGHLARLYREMGMMSEARAEATSLWQDLRTSTTGQKLLAETHPLVRECHGAVYEALGDDRRAAEVYASRISEQAGVATPELHPTFITVLRDLWFARAYAECLARTGQTDSTIAALEETLARPSNGQADLAHRRADRIRLAYLLEARGQKDRAESLWSSLSPSPALALGR